MLFIASTYRLVMDSRFNPLRNLPPAQRFQTMLYLSLMWTTIFCAATTAWAWYGHLVVGHMLVVAGIVVTSLTFHSARRTMTYRDYPLEDSTARYQDVWGG